MEMEPDPDVSADAPNSVVVDALVKTRSFEDGGNVSAGLGTHPSRNRLSMLKGLSLIRQEMPRLWVLAH
jgi:hypothetical protein